MSNAGLIPLRAGEIVAGLWMSAFGVTPQRAERAIHRVLRARGRRVGDGMVYPPVAALYLAPDHYRRLASLLERERPAMEQRIAERLDQDCPSPLRLSVRRDDGVRLLQVAAPVIRNVIPVRRPRRHDPDRTLLDPTRRAPESSGLALQPRRANGAFIAVPAQGLTLGRGVSGPGRVRDRRVSSAHAELTPAGPGRLQCRDLDSRNGTWVDGTRITQVVDLRLGQRLRVGDTRFHIVRHDLTIDGGDA